MSLQNIILSALGIATTLDQTGMIIPRKSLISKLKKSPDIDTMLDTISSEKELIVASIIMVLDNEKYLRQQHPPTNYKEQFPNYMEDGDPSEKVSIYLESLRDAHETLLNLP